MCVSAAVCRVRVCPLHLWTHACATAACRRVPPMSSELMPCMPHDRVTLYLFQSVPSTGTRAIARNSTVEIPHRYGRGPQHIERDACS